MIFKQNYTKTEPSFVYYRNNQIQNVSEYPFLGIMKFKMADTTGLSLTLDPMGTMFQNASSLKPLGQLKPNCPGMIIGRSSTVSEKKRLETFLP
jgi:hypothetical protein